MIKLYKDLLKIYRILLLLGFLVVIVGLILISPKKIFLAILLEGIIYLVYWMILYVIFMNQTIQRFTALSNQLSGNEKIKEGIKELEEMYERVSNKKMKTLLMNNIVGAYINIGELEKAMEYSNQEEPEYENSLIGKQNRIIYTNNLCEISIRTGLYSLAHKNLAVIKELIEDSSFTQEQKTPLNQLYSDLVVELVLEEDKIKDYPSIEKYYLKRFEEEENIASKVFFSHQLMKVYKKLKNTKEEKKYKTFYKENKKELNYD